MHTSTSITPFELYKVGRGSLALIHVESKIRCYTSLIVLSIMTMLNSLFPYILPADPVSASVLPKKKKISLSEENIVMCNSLIGLWENSLLSPTLPMMHVCFPMMVMAAGIEGERPKLEYRRIR